MPCLQNLKKDFSPSPNRCKNYSGAAKLIQTDLRTSFTGFKSRVGELNVTSSSIQKQYQQSELSKTDKSLYSKIYNEKFSKPD